MGPATTDPATAPNAPDLTAPSPLRLWWLAVRPKTLSAAFGPVFIGTALAIASGTWSVLTFIVALLGATFLQIGSNLANDLFDFKKGADTEERLGPTRVTQRGWVTQAQITRATALSFIAAFLVGIYLVVIGGWPIVVIGLLSIVCAVAYTGGPFPLGYHGLGDVTVFVFFGPTAVCGTWYVHTGTWSNLALLTSVAPGLLIAAILIVNNVRDRHTDVTAGKRTLAVRLGYRASLIQYTAQVGLAYAIPVGVALSGAGGWGWCLPLVSLPLALKTTRNVWTHDGRALNPRLGETAKLSLIFSLLLSIGILL